MTTKDHTVNDTSTPSSLSRRALLVTGGATITAGALLAACGGSSSGSNVPRLGEAPTTTALPTGNVTDEVLLRTAMSVEYNAIDTYATVIAAGTFDAATNAVLSQFSADHQAHANALAGLITSMGGAPYAKANPRLTEVYINPALELIAASDDVPGDTLALAHALETLAAQTYQAFVAWINNPAIRAAAMGIGDQEARHTVVLAQAIRGGAAGVLPAVGDDGKNLVAAVPSAFGSLSSIQVSVGKVTEAGTKPTLSLETPSLNSLIYDYLS